MLIAGSVAIVTGGAQGLGRAYCEALLERQAKVCFGDIDVKEGIQTEKALCQRYGEDSVIFVPCDVTKDEDFKNIFAAAVKKFRRLDLFVNNAGIQDESLWQKSIDINLSGVIRGTMLAIEHMRKDKGGNGGVVINVASTAGLFPAFFAPSYVASKYGVVGFTRSWASNPIVESKYGVKLAVLCPSAVNTDILTKFTATENHKVLLYKEFKEEIRKTLYSQGLLETQEMADAFIQLVEREDNNGAVLTVDKKYGMRYRFTKHPHRL